MAIRIIKEQLRRNYRGLNAKVDQDDLINWTRFPAEKVAELVECCIKLNWSQFTKDCVDEFEGNWNGNDRFWFHLFLEKKGKRYLKTLCSNEEFNVEKAIENIKDMFDEIKVLGCEPREDAKSKEAIEKLIIHFRNYFSAQIRSVYYDYAWDVIKLMAGLDIAEDEIPIIIFECNIPGFDKTK